MFSSVACKRLKNQGQDIHCWPMMTSACVHIQESTCTRHILTNPNAVVGVQSDTGPWCSKENLGFCSARFPLLNQLRSKASPGSIQVSSETRCFQTVLEGWRYSSVAQHSQIFRAVGVSVIASTENPQSPLNQGLFLWSTFSLPAASSYCKRDGTNCFTQHWVYSFLASPFAFL